MSLTFWERMSIRRNPRKLIIDNTLMQKASNEDVEYALKYGLKIYGRDIRSMQLSFLEMPAILNAVRELPADDKYRVFEEIISKDGISKKTKTELITELVEDENYKLERPPFRKSISDKELFFELLRKRTELISTDTEIEFDFDETLDMGKILNIIREQNISAKNLPKIILKNQIIINYFMEKNLSDFIELLLNDMSLKYEIEEVYKEWFIEKLPKSIKHLAATSKIVSEYKFSENEKKKIIDSALEEQSISYFDLRNWF